MSVLTKSKKIVVIGSSNTDMMVRTERLPNPGETILGGTFRMGAGGKGANQAIAAKRLGGDVEFFCKVGNDVFGENAKKHYQAEGLDISHVLISSKPSGVALITVDKNAENSIVVASGANSDISTADVMSISDVIASAEILLLQLETPIEAVCKSAEIAYNNGVFVVLNPAPACEIPEELYRHISLLIPNETETALMTDNEVTDCTSAERAAKILMEKGVKNVIVTMGSKGALLCSSGKKASFTPSRKVHAVDTTAAGDTFCGGICVALSEGKTLEEAITFATAASSLTVQKMGAQESIPMRSDVEKIIN